MYVRMYLQYLILKKKFEQTSDGILYLLLFTFYSYQSGVVFSVLERYMPGNAVSKPIIAIDRNILSVFLGMKHSF